MKKDIKSAIIITSIFLFLSFVLFGVSFFIVQKGDNILYFEIGISLSIIMVLFILINGFNKKEKKNIIDKRAGTFNSNDFKHVTYNNERVKFYYTILFLIIIAIIVSIIHVFVL